MARLLLTGAGGYLGSAVAAALDAAGLDWAPLAGRLEHIGPGSLQTGTVIHCAGALRHQPERLQRDNVEGTARLLAGLRGPGRVLFASSRSVYGAAPGACCDETDPARPQDAYGQSKRQAELLLQASGRPVLCARLATLFGNAPRGDCPSLPNQALRRWRQGDTLHLVADDPLVDYLAVGDAARLLVLLAQAPWPGPLLNLPGPARGLQAMVESLAAAARAQGLAACVLTDHPPGPPWPRLGDRLLRRWLPDFRPTSDAEVARAWLQAHPPGAAPAG